MINSNHRLLDHPLWPDRQPYEFALIPLYPLAYDRSSCPSLFHLDRPHNVSHQHLQRTVRCHSTMQQQPYNRMMNQDLCHRTILLYWWFDQEFHFIWSIVPSNIPFKNFSSSSYSSRSSSDSSSSSVSASSSYEIKTQVKRWIIIRIRWNNSRKCWTYFIFHFFFIIIMVWFFGVLLRMSWQTV